MGYLITELFIAVYLFLVHRSNQRLGTDLSGLLLTGAFLLRIAAGIAYGYIFQHYYGGDDTWYFNRGIMEEYIKLQQQPLQFFAELNPVPAFERNMGEGLLAGWYYYLSDLEFWLLTKPFAFLQVFTNGNYYLNMVFLNAWTFFGSLWLYRFLRKRVSGSGTWLKLLCFYFPPLVFWWSGIRADGLLFFFSVLLLIRFAQWLETGKKREWIWMGLAAAGILILRSVLLLVWIPALMAWWLHQRKGWSTLKAAAIVYGAGILIFFASTLLPHQFNLPGFVVKRQQSFFELKGNTRFALDSLRPTPPSFIQTAPQALANTTVRPLPWEAKGALQWVSAAEGLFLLALLCFFLLRYKKDFAVQHRQAFLFFPLLFAVSLYFFIGYTIPFPGAIVRYRVQAEIFLFLYMTLRMRAPEK